MKTSNYQMPIDWRRVHFSLTHPMVAPDQFSNHNLPIDLSLFLPTEYISDVREVRDWLHNQAHTAGHYDLFGRYRTTQTRYQFQSLFLGIIVVFYRAIDAFQFRLSWNTLILEAA